MTWRYPDVDWVVAYHDELMKAQGHPAELMDRGKLEGALERPRAEAFGAEAYPAAAEKCAVLLQGVAIAHAFKDGNKRAALGSMLSLLELNGYPIDASEAGLFDLVIGVTTGTLREVEDIATRIRELFKLAD